MPSHHLHDEGSLVGAGSRYDVIHCLNDSVESRVSTDGHVRSTEVVVNGSNHTDNVQVRVAHHLVVRNQIPVFQLFQKIWGRIRIRIT